MKGDITKEEGVTFFQTDNLKIDFNESHKNLCVDGERFPTVASSYQFHTRGKVRMLLPKHSQNLF